MFNQKWEIVEDSDELVVVSRRWKRGAGAVDPWPWHVTEQGMHGAGVDSA
jgi:hypothetical protein